MFLPFDIGGIHGVLALVYKVIHVGWSNVHDAHQQYMEFKEDIETLKEQLETLQLTISISRVRTGARLAPTGQLQHIFANFKETLENCLQLVERQARHGAHQGVAFNMQWFLAVRDEVNMHRDRIAVLNAKLSLALQSLEIESRNGQSILILECTNLVIERLDQLETRVSRALGQPLITEAPPRLDVPAPLENLFESITLTRYGSLTSIPMAQGVDEIIFYLDRATQWQARRQSTQRCHAFRLANLLRAYWLLQATKASDEYQAASARITVTEFERQFPRLGMTARRFFSKLEEKIFQAHSQLSRSGEPAPPLHELQEIIVQESNAWEEHKQWEPQPEEIDNLRQGKKVATCRLRTTSTTTGQTLEVFQQEDQGHLTVIKGGAGRAEQVHEVDLKGLHLAPFPEAATFNNPLYSVTLNLVKSRKEKGFKWSFQGEEDLFEFQEWMTGYKVVDDFPGTIVTSQRANAVIGGERRSDTGRVQIWSSTRPSPGPQLPEEFLDSEPSAKPRSTYARTVSPYAPVLAPLASFSRLSLSLHPIRSASTGSVLLDAPALTQTRSITPSLTRTSTVTSSTSLSSSSSLSGRSSLTRRPTNNMIQVDRRGNVGCILDLPDPPRIVVFLPTSTSQQQGPKGAESGSLLVIDINQYIRINPTLCDCHQDRAAQPVVNGQQTLDRNGILSLDFNTSTTTTPSQLTPSPRQAPLSPSQQQQQGQCRKVVLQVVQESGITARETDSGERDWNLASAGRYQDGEGLGRMKRLKKVTIVFGSVGERVRFVKYFTDLRALYLGHLNAVRG